MRMVTLVGPRFSKLSIKIGGYRGSRTHRPPRTATLPCKSGRSYFRFLHTQIGTPSRIRTHNRTFEASHDIQFHHRCINKNNLASGLTRRYYRRRSYKSYHELLHHSWIKNVSLSDKQFWDCGYIQPIIPNALNMKLAPAVGLEPTTFWLTVRRIYHWATPEWNHFLLCNVWGLLGRLYAIRLGF